MMVALGVIGVTLLVVLLVIGAGICAVKLEDPEFRRRLGLKPKK